MVDEKLVAADPEPGTAAQLDRAVLWLSRHWLAYLTGNAFSPTFYVGNALGSLNSWMRLITGLLAGLAITWTVYPLLDDGLR